MSRPSYPVWKRTSLPGHWFQSKSSPFGKVHLRARPAQNFTTCQHFSPGSFFVLAELAPQNGDQCWRRRLFDWKVAGPLLLFRVKASATSGGRHQEKRLAKARQILKRKWLEMHMLQKYTQQGLSVLGDLVAFTTASPWETPRSSLFKSQASWLALSFPKSGCWKQVSKSSATLSLQAALKEWRPCASCRTCRATLVSKEERMPASIALANFGKP